MKAVPKRPPEDRVAGPSKQKEPEKRRQMEVVIESSGTKTTKPKVPVEEPPPEQSEEQPPVVRTEAKQKKRVTIEEVEDSEDERDYVRSKKVNDELPFRDVEPLKEGLSAPVLPRKPSGTSASAAGEKTQKRKRAVKNTERSDRATSRIADDIRNLRVPAAVGDLMDSNPKLARTLLAEEPKTRWPDFVKTTEGDIRAPKVSTFTASHVYEASEDGDSSEEEELVEIGVNERVEPTDLTIVDSKGRAAKMLMFDTYPEIVTSSGHELAEGSIIIGDPVLQYFESLAPDETPMDITLAMAPLSGKLRCLFPMVKGCRVEGISDSGSQIVSMSLEIALKLQLDWDTRMTILMQAANDQVQRTLGLAKNVPFRFGSVVLYLQVHVLKVAPYDVLLGRPFEMLAETVVSNKRNGDVFMTLTDPYTGIQSTMPTYPRGYQLPEEVASSNKSENGSTSKVVPQDF
jgi:hypothetical protein